MVIHIFIVNPYAGREVYADELRGKLEKIPDLTFFIFTTRYAGHEEALVRKAVDLFSDEKLRFYCCGGSGTLRNMLNGIEDFSEVEMAVYPCGLSNDFFKVFEEDEEKFSDLEALVNGDVVDIDYIRSNHGVCLNTLSAGVDARVSRYMEKYRELYMVGKQLPYTLSLLNSLFMTDPNDLVIYLDGEKMEVSCSEIVFANGLAIGGNLYLDSAADITDGEGCYLIAPPKIGFSLLHLLLYLKRRKMDKVRQKMKCGRWCRVHIESKDGRPLVVNQDGELVGGYPEWDAEIVRKGLHFVVPRGVKE